MTGAATPPLLPRAAEIPYSEFTVKLSEGQITDVTLWTPIEGVMKNPEGQTPLAPEKCLAAGAARRAGQGSVCCAQSRAT